MQEFTGIEYTKIAIANAFGLDKELFDERIKWVDGMIVDGLLDSNNLLDCTTDLAEEPALFTSGIISLRDALTSEPSGYMVGLDACASGIQIMGALIGCEATCRSTGLIDPNVRADIYTSAEDVMNTKLAAQGIVLSHSRADLKDATMTHFYGSKMKPIEIFGEDTVELEAFYESLSDIAPGAVIVMEHLLASWQPYALEHTWTLPDGFKAIVKVVDEVDFKVEVDELDHCTFTHRIYENQGKETGLSIAANVVHSIDGMVVREMNRRCNYDDNKLVTVMLQIERELGEVLDNTNANYDNFVSLVMVDKIYTGELALADVDDETICALYETIIKSVGHKSFPLICVHDEFKCHPNNMNHLRQHYIDIFSELSQSNLLHDILAEVHGVKSYQLHKLGNVSQLIEQSNYSLS
jgi:hypothetical protein